MRVTSKMTVGGSLRGLQGRLEGDGRAQVATGGSAGAAVGIADLDVADAIMGLHVEAVAHHATLRALERPLPDTLVSFLR